MVETDRPGQSRRAFTPAEAFKLAVDLHRQGRLVEAEQIYRGILKLEPGHAGALQYCGMIATQSGRVQEAERLIRQALAITPDSAEARNNLGIALAAQGRQDEALAEYERAVALDGAYVEARNNLGNTLHTLGRSAEAIGHFECALALRPELADLHNNLGNALARAGRQEEAVARFRKALELRPDFPEAHNNIGFVLAALGRHSEAIPEYERAVALKPRYFEAYNNLANAFAALARYAEAVPHFEQALAVKPDVPETQNNFGIALSTLIRHDEAARHYRAAIEAKPDMFEAHNNLGNALVALSQHKEAIDAFERALALDPKSAGSLCNLGNSLAAVDRFDEALARYHEALALYPDHAEAHASLGNTLRVMGRFDEARAALEKAVELAPHRAEFHRSLAESKRYNADDAQLTAMESLAADIDALSEDERIALHFALGKAYADVGGHQKAFAHLLEGNALKRRQVQYDEARTLAQFDRLKAVFTPELFRRMQGLGDPSELPIFIIGMPRSGTTLVEQVLASHSKVLGAGELEHLAKVLGRLERPGNGGTPFPELVSKLNEEQLRGVAADYIAALPSTAPPVERITDKMPANFRLAGMIHLVFPNSRIIHVRRDPLDTCLSCFSKLFVDSLPFSYDLAELGRYYRAYDDLMRLWRTVLPQGAMLEVQYENLVEDFERQARRIVAYCNLDWEDRCAAFYETQRPVRTASVMQVRQPIYDSSVGRSRSYKAWLGPLLEQLNIP